MSMWLKLLATVTIIFSTSSFVWFLLRATAYFQREMDIIGHLYLFAVGIPVILSVMLFTSLLIKGTTPTSGLHNTGICVGMAISFLLSVILIHGVNSHGWGEQRIESDSLKSTTDGKYEYKVELINLFQRNSSARLYLRDVDSGEEKYIPLNIQTRKIVVLGVREVNHWIILESTAKASQYFLSTTKELRIPAEKFEIDIRAGTSRKLE